MGAVWMSALMLLLLCIEIECRSSVTGHDKVSVNADDDQLNHLNIKQHNILPRSTETGQFFHIYSQLSYVLWIISSSLISNASSCNKYKNYVLFSDYRTSQLPRFCGMLRSVCRKTPTAVQSSDCFVRYTAVALQATCCQGAPKDLPIATTTTTIATTTTKIPPAIQKCGKSNITLGRIVGGTDARECEFPWLVYLTNTFDRICGGAILNERQVLTAAHCVGSSRQYFIEAGQYQAEFNSTLDRYRQVIKVKDVMEHVNYFPYENDIAILTLERPIEFGVCAQPICLPETQDVPQTAKCTVAGWGVLQFQMFKFPKVLQKVDVTVHVPSACLQKYGFKRYQRTKSVLCTDNNGLGGKDSCQGDSGGPLMCLINGAYTVFGVVSNGDGCASPNEPGHYTYVPYFRTWINERLIR